MDRVRAVLGERTAGLDAVARAVADYLAAARGLGRVAPTTDPEAPALVGVPTAPNDRERLRRTIAALVPPNR
ncbi:hypothetical protein GCM10022243_67420 [Saccharothrix violaceirubra]|uniref:Uncharacterized protein n=1 Tax=Saccharothrix violaceirubra TaxID=413306 RepID=A0A7W7T3F5_9PSEU|nr:hypothetical protein [Saccharothrix violaceirubra]MBB4965307.1 hypothetical protein [Saccharothrix violaceirubra]